MTAGLVTCVFPFTKASGDKSSFAEATGDKHHPPSHYVRHPPPMFHPRDTSRGARGRWAFIRPTRRIIVILSILGRGGLDHPADCVGTPPQRGTLFCDGNLVCSCRGASGAGISRRFYGKNPQILLDNARVRGYSMFAFRVNKERKKHRILHILTDL